VDKNGNAPATWNQRLYDRETGRLVQDGLHQQIGMWQTPQTPKGGGRSRGQDRTDEALLPGQAAMWPTANARDADKWNNRAPGHDRQVNLSGHANNWPTPRTITGGGESAERKQALGRVEPGGGDLQAASTTWPTPVQSDGHKCSHPRREGDATLPHSARTFPSSPPARPTSTPGRALPNWTAPSCPRLNPNFVEWLMGWCPGTSDCTSSATAWSRYRRRTRSALCSLLSMDQTETAAA